MISVFGPKKTPRKKIKKNASLYLMNFDYLSYESNLLIIGHPHICDRGASTHFYQRGRISRKIHRIYQDQTNSLRVIRLEVFRQNVLVLNVLVLNRAPLGYHDEVLYKLFLYCNLKCAKTIPTLLSVVEMSMSLLKMARRTCLSMGANIASIQHKVDKTKAIYKRNKFYKHFSLITNFWRMRQILSRLNQKFQSNK